MPKTGSSTREYRIWDKEEEDALRDGVRKHGLGAWERIRTDPAYSVLLGRTGVQLKDKWRNLVKFRHVSTQETQNLQHCGNWHRRAGDVRRKRARSGQRSEPDEAPSSGGEQGARPDRSSPTSSHEADREAQQAMRKSQRASTFQRRSWAAAAELAAEDEVLEEDAIEGDNEGESSSEHSGRQRKRRRIPRNHQEDRRFGIYDRRRYSSVSPGPGHSHGSEGPPDTAAGGIGDGHATSAGGAASGRQRRPAAAADGAGRQRRRRPEAGGSSGAEEGSDGDEDEDEEEDEEEYIVDCPCGVRYDDGEMMIECESCKAWSHTRCLQEQMAANPLCKYNFMHFSCMRCQRVQARQRQQLMGRAAAAAAAAAEQQGLFPGNGRPAVQPPGAAGAAARNGLRRQRPGRGSGSRQRHQRRRSVPGDASSSGGDPGQTSSSGYGMEGSDGDREASMEDYLVDIDPVLLLILQGALYINRRPRNAAMRHPRRVPHSWGRAALAGTQHPAGGWLPPLKVDPLPPSWRSMAAGAGGSSRRRRLSPPPQHQHQRQRQPYRDLGEGPPGGYASEDELGWVHGPRPGASAAPWGSRRFEGSKESWQQQQQPGPLRATAVKSSAFKAGGGGMLRGSGPPGSARPYPPPQQQPHPGGLPGWHSTLGGGRGASSLSAALLGIQASVSGSQGMMPPIAAEDDRGGLHLLAAVAPGSPPGMQHPSSAGAGLVAGCSSRVPDSADGGTDPSRTARSLLDSVLLEAPPAGHATALLQPRPMRQEADALGGSVTHPSADPLLPDAGPSSARSLLPAQYQHPPGWGAPSSPLQLHGSSRPGGPGIRPGASRQPLGATGASAGSRGAGHGAGGGSEGLADAGLLLSAVHDVRPLTPDPFGLFRSHTPELLALHGLHLHLGGNLGDLPGAGAWPLSKTPPLPEGLLGLTAGLASTSGHLTFSLDHPPAAGRSQEDSLKGGLPGTAAAAATLAAAAAAAGGGVGRDAAAAATAGGGNHLSIDELVLQPQVKEEGMGAVPRGLAPTPPPSLVAAMAAMAHDLERKPGAIGSSSAARGALGMAPGVHPQQQQQQTGGPPTHPAADAPTRTGEKFGGSGGLAAGVHPPSVGQEGPQEARMGAAPAANGSASTGAGAAAGGGSKDSGAVGMEPEASQPSLVAALAAAAAAPTDSFVHQPTAVRANWPAPIPESVPMPQQPSLGAALAAAAAAKAGRHQQQQQQQQPPPLSALAGACPLPRPAAAGPWSSLGAALAAAAATEQPMRERAFPTDAQQHN